LYQELTEDEVEVRYEYLVVRYFSYHRRDGRRQDVGRRWLGAYRVNLYQELTEDKVETEYECLVARYFDYHRRNGRWRDRLGGYRFDLTGQRREIALDLRDLIGELIHLVLHHRDGRWRDVGRRRRSRLGVYRVNLYQELTEDKVKAGYECLIARYFGYHRRDECRRDIRCL
jgi:hypothetical protein